MTRPHISITQQDIPDSFMWTWSRCSQKEQERASLNIYILLSLCVYNILSYGSKLFTWGNLGSGSSMNTQKEKIVAIFANIISDGDFGGSLGKQAKMRREKIFNFVKNCTVLTDFAGLGFCRD